MPKDDRPLTHRELARYVGRPMKGDEAIELEGGPALRTISFDGDGDGDGDDESAPDIRLKPIRGDKGGRPLAWELVSSRPFRMGIDVKEVGRAKLPAKGADLPDQLDPFLPGDRVLGDAAELAEPEPVRHLRRRNGRRVRPEVVFGQYKRQTYTPSSVKGAAHSLVGKISVSPQGMKSYGGSAVLIGERTILTAAHVIPWFHVELGIPFSATFVPASFDGVSRFTRKDGSNPVAACTAAWGYPGHDQGDDMAVWKLDQPLGKEWGFFGAKTYDDDWEDVPCWRLNGYPDDMSGATRPARVGNFPIIDDDDDGAGVELEHMADSFDGMSGGPLWGWWEWKGAPKPFAIGTHVGGEDAFAEDRHNLAAGGPALVALVHWARHHWG